MPIQLYQHTTYLEKQYKKKKQKLVNSCTSLISQTPHALPQNVYIFVYKF